VDLSRHNITRTDVSNQQFTYVPQGSGFKRVKYYEDLELQTLAEFLYTKQYYLTGDSAFTWQYDYFYTRRLQVKLRRVKR
jgi:hypothetical protein